MEVLQIFQLTWLPRMSLSVPFGLQHSNFAGNCWACPRVPQQLPGRECWNKCVYFTHLLLKMQKRAAWRAVKRPLRKKVLQWLSKWVVAKKQTTDAQVAKCLVLRTSATLSRLANAQWALAGKVWNNCAQRERRNISSLERRDTFPAKLLRKWARK